MTEDEARAALRGFPSFDRFEAWIADQSWQATPTGWTVSTELEGWRFQVALVPEGLRLVALAPSGGGLAIWLVPS